MQFEHTEEQLMIRSAARELLESYDSARLRAAIGAPGGYEAALWQQMGGELGWCGLALPERYGGAGLGWIELCLLQEELGRRLVASPFFASAVLGAALVMECATEAQRQELLSPLARGQMRFGCAITGPGGHPAPQGVDAEITSAGASLRLSGVADFVIHGDTADVLLVLAREGGGLSLVSIPAGTSGVHVIPHVMMDLTRPMSRIEFQDVTLGADARLGAPGAAALPLERALDLARIALAAEAVGAAERVLEMTGDYLKQRVQFGRPLGSFQALKHRMADLMTEVEAAKSAAWYAACAAQERPEECAEAAAIAKSYCCDAFYSCAAGSVQLHGGIGFTWEHDAHLYFKRARASATLLGSPVWQRERLLRVLGLGAAATPAF
ncbi:MAG: acyl-CoA/acyl-ACP dehydrogenase [Proteobacteria bacterium]|nr:acyl-CoA/acyl-ACP dehydrogenase [Pseudomonadota bacterium]